MSKHTRRLKPNIKVFVGIPFLGIGGSSEAFLSKALRSIMTQRTKVKMLNPWVTRTPSGRGETRYLVARKMNEIFIKFLKTDCTHVWLVDADCELPQNALEELISLDVDVASGVSPTHDDWNETTAAFEHLGGGLNFYRRTDIEGRVVGESEVVATGGFCMLIKRRALLRYSPYHKPLRYQVKREMKAIYGPELQFFVDAQSMGFSVRLHGGVMCGHLPEYPLSYKGGEDTLHNKIKEIKWRKAKRLPTSWLIIVDVYDWAWDIASKELLKALPETTGTIVDIKDFKNVDPMRYHVVLIYPWAAMKIIKRLSPKNTVICMAGGEQLSMMNAFKQMCGRFNFFGACNELIQDALRKALPDKNILHLTHGVDSALFKPAKTRRRKEFTIGWVGSSTRAIKRFYLANEIAEQGEFNLRAATFKKYTHDKMPQYYHSIDVLIVTSMYEAHPLVVYEAMSCGIPVVTTNVGDVDRYIINGENGFILPLNAQPSEYVSILDRLKKDKKLRMQVGEAARQTVIEKLSWAEIVKQYIPIPKLMEAK